MSSSLGDAYRECLPILDRMKADGVPFPERIKGLEGVIRQHWPFTREWQYLCGECSDYGLRMVQCPGDATCQRSKPHLPHDFGTPCWCQAGKRFKAPERTEQTALQAAATVKKPARFGR